MLARQSALLVVALLALSNVHAAPFLGVHREGIVVPVLEDGFYVANRIIPFHVNADGQYYLKLLEWEGSAISRPIVQPGAVIATNQNPGGYIQMEVTSQGAPILVPILRYTDEPSSKVVLQPGNQYQLNLTVHVPANKLTGKVAIVIAESIPPVRANGAGLDPSVTYVLGFGQTPAGNLETPGALAPKTPFKLPAELNLLGLGAMMAVMLTVGLTGSIMWAGRR